MDNENLFFNMQYTLGDILMIIGYVGGLIATYVVITSRITRLEVRLDTFVETSGEKINLLREEVNKNKSDIERERRYVVEKLAQIESGQTKTNIFLEENLKNLTRIITLHETEIHKMKAKLEEYDKNIIAFYRDFEMPKKEK